MTASPVVIVTLAAMPAGVVGALGGAPGLTPNLDRLATESWHARAVASSSSPAPSLASLLTGVDPWQHQILSHRASTPRPDVGSLPSLLPGWTSRAYLPPRYRAQDNGLFDGFTDVEQAKGDDDDELSRGLETLDGQELVFVHLPDPGFPWLDRSEEVPRLAPPRTELSRMEARWLMPYADPERDVPASLLASARDLYAHEVAWADARVGSLLSALRRNPSWPQITLVVTALHGNELQEHGQALFAQNLNRQAIEVPLFVKWPAAWQRRVPDRRYVSTTRIAATILELCGRRPPPALAPSLFRSWGQAVSALYDHDGINRHSLLRSAPGGDLQLLWQSRYADPEAEIWVAQAAEAGLGGLELREPHQMIFGRLRLAFQKAPPLHGRAPGSPLLELVRWTEQGGVESVSDPVKAQEMAADLQRHWLRWVDRERSPRSERALRAEPSKP